MEKVKLLKGDNIELLKTLEDNSVDSVVTDPPYGLSFMNKKWDYNVPSVELWKEVLRVLKPGGHVLSFGGTRTYHRMVVNMEDAGFEIRDSISYMYGSGFPKSHNISKSIDKKYGRLGFDLSDIKTKLKELYKSSGKTMKKIDEECGFKATGYLRIEHRDDDGWGEALPTVERWGIIKEVINYRLNDLDNIFEEAEREITGSKSSGLFNGGEGNSVGGTIVSEVDITKSKTKEGSEWEGWGTALKPSMELICLARKPLSEKSIAENVLKHGTGGINIDDCRVEYENTPNAATNPKYRKENGYKLPEPGQESNGAVQFTSSKNEINTEGRFPANTILECICDEPHSNTECPCYILDKQSGVSKSTGSVRKKDTDTDPSSMDFKHKEGENSNKYAGQVGGASRFFYTAKVSKKERNMGLEPVEIFHQRPRRDDGSVIYKEKDPKEWAEAMAKLPRKDKTSKAAAEEKLQTQSTSVKNIHPTVKPVNLMTYLCRLITPPNGVVLDMYMGSGSTGISALLEGFRFIGMEMDEDYFNIAEARIKNFEQYRQFIKK